MHDHIPNFKLDLDALGTANMMQMTTLALVAEGYLQFQDRARHTMKLQRPVVESENESKVNSEFSSSLVNAAS
ncbi:hypothetical protein AOQ84DRAFT_381003 [Glonium stellatum]|uniref:Uncharacterized protein n=1 Tax=Glonium stellatum TaxID=574774 RepID=A0A8E2ESF1_9PEZI|nr:hypothetical protein AOQ84DRAFT_381003 [Glonium stellatum]